MPASIAEAESQIRHLREEITKYEKKVKACDRVKIVFEKNRNKLLNEYDNLDTYAARANDNIEIGADSGYKAFSEGAMYMENEEGTSRDFANLKNDNLDCTEASHKLIEEKNEAITKLKEAINQAEQNQEKFSQHIKNCEREIASLSSWIEEEIRNQEEEKAEEQDRNWINQAY